MLTTKKVYLTEWPWNFDTSSSNIWRQEDHGLCWQKMTEMNGLCSSSSHRSCILFWTVHVSFLHSLSKQASLWTTAVRGVMSGLSSHSSLHTKFRGVTQRGDRRAKSKRAPQNKFVCMLITGESDLTSVTIYQSDCNVFPHVTLFFLTPDIKREVFSHSCGT